MANNESKFSSIIECVSKDGLDFIVELLSPQAGDYIDRYGDPHIDMEPCEFESHTYKSLWVHDFEGGGITDRLVDASARYQIKFVDPKPIAIEWAETCDEPRVSEFGGGAVVILRGIVHWQSTRYWVAEKITELTK